MQLSLFDDDYKNKTMFCFKQKDDLLIDFFYDEKNGKLDSKKLIKAFYSNKKIIRSNRYAYWVDNFTVFVKKSPFSDSIRNCMNFHVGELGQIRPFKLKGFKNVVNYLRGKKFRTFVDFDQVNFKI